MKQYRSHVKYIDRAHLGYYIKGYHFGILKYKQLNILSLIKPNTRPKLFNLCSMPASVSKSEY